MIKRILTALVALCVLIPVLFLSHTVVLPIGISVVILFCLYEIFKCTGVGRKLPMLLPIYIFGVAAPFMIRYIGNMGVFSRIAFIATAIYLIYLMALIVWSHGKMPFGETMTAFFLALYIIAALSSLLYVRYFGEAGKYLYLLIFIGAWVTDVFAYFTGVFFGKHKLIEDVSPKKTVEGSMGGILFCALGFAVFGIVLKYWFGQDPNFLFLIIAGVVLSIVSQIGDLIMSVVKRHYKIKDFGNIFPGHGGMLDRFDSILAVSLGLGAICSFVTLTGIQLM